MKDRFKIQLPENYHYLNQGTSTIDGGKNNQNKQKQTNKQTYSLSPKHTTSKQTNKQT